MPRTKDSTGHRFGRLIALRQTHQDSRGTWHWRCRCDCGELAVVAGDHLRGGRIRSCGCLNLDSLKNRAIDVTGQRFGRLVAISRAHQRYEDKGGWCWRCRCDCGETIITRLDALLSGATQSCRCLQIENTVKANLTHGDARKGLLTTEYKCWIAMMQRCYNPNCSSFKYYGARGIKVCKRWHKFENFLADMGRRPQGLTIERMNNDGPYAKWNCKWATHTEQMNNTRRTRRR